MPTNQGSVRLFRFSGIDVFLHWSWFVVAVFEINGGIGHYSSFVWHIFEYLALFAIITNSDTRSLAGKLEERQTELCSGRSGEWLL
jgi:hypothetical protein